MRLSLSSMHSLLPFTKVGRALGAIVQPVVDSPTPRVRVLAHRLGLLLSVWIGISVAIDLLLHLTGAASLPLPVVAYLLLGLAMLARYPLWTPHWFVDTTPMSMHLIWLGSGLLLALMGSFAFPGNLPGFLAILAVEGHVILSFTDRRRGRIWFVGMAVLAACLYMTSVGGQAGLIIALRAAPFAVVALIGLDLLVNAFFPVAVDKPVETATQEQSDDSVQRYRHYVNRIEALAVAKERARIAREFHDTLGHTLTTLDVQMELMARLSANRVEEIQEAARQSRVLVKQGLADVRRSIRALHPTALEGFSIIEAIQSLVDEFKRATQVGIQWRIEGKVAPIAPDLALPLHRSAQEALTNIRRHSGATEVKMTLIFATETICLVVEDNGRAQTPQKFGFGLSGIRDRVHELHGHFAASPRSEGGFRVVVELPR